jgi:hypothetical protein
MERFRTDLARTVDGLAAAGRATVTESRDELALYQLDAEGARQVLARLDPAGFALFRLADEGGDILADDVADESIGIELVARKPAVPDGVLPILSQTGFRALLERVHPEAVIWLQGLEHPIETITVAYQPWGSDNPFTPAEGPPEPARVVRHLLDLHGPAPIGRWLLRDSQQDVSGPRLSPWREHACRALSVAISQEVERDGRLLFRGPPPTRFRCEAAPRVEVGSLANLQCAASWVYENPRELENRHGLMAAEIARTALRDGDLADLAGVTASALEGAKIAYGFGVSQQSRDALKTLSDLRKAVADETGKLSDATRSLAAAVTTSAVGNVGLVIARLTLAKGSTFVSVAAGVIGLALAIYVGVVIASGWHFLTIQRDLRNDWRERLYRFLGDDEYGRMVTGPVARAEKGFRNAAIGSAIVSLLELVAVLIVIFR